MSNDGLELPHPPAQKAWTARKQATHDYSERTAEQRRGWIERNRFYYEDHYRYMRFLVPEGARVLDIGCGTGDLLAAIGAPGSVGVDLSAAMVAVAQHDNPEFTYHVGDIEDPDLISQLEGPFDVIILSDAIGSLEDIETTFASLHALCTSDTRLVISYYSRLWEPILKIAEHLGDKQRHLPQNWLSTDDIAGLLDLADFDVVKREWRQLFPKRIWGIGGLINRYLGPLPVIRRFSLRNYIVARPAKRVGLSDASVTVLVPCRNEKGNIESAVTRTPSMGPKTEILFVEGNSQDGTWDEIQRVIAAYPDRSIRALKQDGKGKGDAVRKGFSNAACDVLMILDADLTVPPETLPKFYKAITEGKGEFINGTRLVYPMDRDAMRFLNWIANRTFSILFSWLLNQRLTDTLCGTKVLTKEHYDRIASNRGYFGVFDPFGDYDLIFGAAKLNLKIAEIPIRYAAREYGETQISRFSDGLLLIKMVAFAWRKLKAF